jgi:N,N'-diacetyllegionaminate synthase
MSTPFDEASVDLLDSLGVPLFKVGSGEITNWPFLETIARKGKPFILSTGMSYLSEVDEAVRVMHNAGNDQLVLLHCVSNYPADPADANLRVLQTMASAFQVPVGYSDHTIGNEVALAAVALGACVIEKHFTLDKNLPGPDHRASAEPGELAMLVRGIRVVEAALGHGSKRPAASEANTAAVARRSLVAARDIAAGTVLTEEMIAIKRPGTGLPPAMRPYLVGRTARTAIPADTILTLEMLA